MIGLNRVKDFLLLIIIMKSSEILTNFVDKRRHNLFSELENGKITRTPSLFLPSSIFFLHTSNHKHTSLYGYWIDTRTTRIHSSYAKLSREVRVKDPTADLIFLRKTFLKPLFRVFFAKSSRRLKPVLAYPDSCG